MNSLWYSGSYIFFSSPEKRLHKPTFPFNPNNPLKVFIIVVVPYHNAVVIAIDFAVEKPPEILLSREVFTFLYSDIPLLEPFRKP